MPPHSSSSRAWGASGSDTAHLLWHGRNLVLSVISFNSASRQIKFTTLTSASLPSERSVSRPVRGGFAGCEAAELGWAGVKGVCRATLADIASKLLNFGHVSAPGLSLSLSISFSLRPCHLFCFIGPSGGGRLRARLEVDVFGHDDFICIL